MENEYLDNKTYDFIGRLAYALHEQDIKISYTSLIHILKDNNLDDYGSERGVASAVRLLGDVGKKLKALILPSVFASLKLSLAWMESLLG